MRQILIIDEARDKYQALQKKLEALLAVEITREKESKSALFLLKILPELEFILIKSGIEKQGVLSKIENFLVQESSVIPLLVFGKAQKKSIY